MEAARENKRTRTVTLTVPSSDYSFLRSITTRMGWTITPTPRKRKSGLEQAMEDVKAGRVYSFDNVDDAIKWLND